MSFLNPFKKSDTYGEHTPELLEIFKRNSQKIEIDGLNIHSLPPLPNTLQILRCNNNQLTSLPELPEGLKILECGNNQLTSLPELPDGLQRLECYTNPLTSLPELPEELRELRCDRTELTALPELPRILITLRCSNTQLTSLPPLPENLVSLKCFNNPNLTRITGPCPAYLYNNPVEEHIYNCPKLILQPRNRERCGEFFDRFASHLESSKTHRLKRDVGSRSLVNSLEDVSNGMNSQPIIGGKRKTHRNKQTRRRKAPKRKTRKQKRSYK